MRCMYTTQDVGIHDAGVYRANGPLQLDERNPGAGAGHKGFTVDGMVRHALAAAAPILNVPVPSPSRRHSGVFVGAPV